MKLALTQKDKLDEMILLSDKVYVCLSCGAISDYWKQGKLCQSCEVQAEWQEDFKDGQN